MRAAVISSVSPPGSVSDININYGSKTPTGLDGNLKGANLGIIAFHVNGVTDLIDQSSSSLPEVEITILDADEACSENLELFLDAPIPFSSSVPFDVLKVDTDNEGYLDE